jgi:hypothetical protein
LRKRGTGEKTKVPEEKPLSIRLLGPPEVSFEGRSLRFGRKKALALLCYLAAEGGKRSRRELAELLWPRSDHRSARTDLRSVLTRVRQTLAENGASGAFRRDELHLLVVEGDLLESITGPFRVIGRWREATVLNEANGRIAYRFHARDLHLVMGPAARETSVRFRVLIDGQSPGAAHGIDVDDQGNGTVTEQRMYQLIRQPKPIADRQFEIEFLDSGVEAFAFTFG